MNIYVETNFVLELVFEQEQFTSCEQILQLCDAGLAKLIIPAYSLAEPHEKLTRQSRRRKEFASRLEIELKQLSRTASYTYLLNNIQEIPGLLVESNQREKQRSIEYRDRLLKTGEAIALTADIIIEAADAEVIYDLSPQDALVYASVISHLRHDRPERSCFLNRNSKDFDSPDIVEELNQFNCKMIGRFDRGYNFIRSQCLP